MNHREDRKWWTRIRTMLGSSHQRTVRVAGFMFLFSFIVPTLNWALGLSTLVVADNAAATAENILANEQLFRVGITIELIMSAGLVVLAVALYSILKKVDPELALLALALKVMEAGLVAAIVLLSLAALLFANGAFSSDAFTSGQVQLPVGILLNTHTALFAGPMVILGLDMTVFFYLFFRSGYIPRLISGFGILSFLLILVHALAYFVAPALASTPVAQAIFYIPSGIVELVVGSWLLTKGINTVGEPCY